MRLYFSITSYLLILLTTLAALEDDLKCSRNVKPAMDIAAPINFA